MLITYSDQEPPEDSTTLRNKKGRQALSNLRRELSEDELKSPAVQRMLLDKVDTLETDVDELGQFRDKFYSAKEEAAVLRERLRASGPRDICLAVGAGIIGLVPSLSSGPSLGMWIAGVIGAVLILSAVLAKRFRS